ncbi:MAG: bifunctional oligoribonuclease/PAP phosphatase NrnA [Candidatus Aminicenantes bacterium]|nr:bifunctional oligoribonuclease/PAP phosphatase NrnA [Candidatus Aminicenantes bacterium]
MRNLEIKKKIAEKLKKSKSVAITCHLRPDGDCIGTALALMLSLREMGKIADVFNVDTTPRFLKKLPAAGEIKIGKIPEGFECIVFMETSALERSGQTRGSSFTIHIDHHRTSESFADLNWIEADRSSVGEMIFELLMENNFPFNKDIATCLYAAIFSDTGGFRFSNTTPRALKYASLLVEAGAQPNKVSRILLENHKEEELLLLRRILDTLKFNESHKIVAGFLMRDFLREISIDLHDLETEFIMNILRAVDKVEVVLLFKELEDGYRVSLRSKSNVDVGKIAEYFGGGGHPQAAGFSINLSKDEALTTVFKTIEEMFPWVKKQG